jgi:hypothetical protein
MFSRPCQHCADLIREIGIKTVYYSIDDDLNTEHHPPPPYMNLFCSRKHHNPITLTSPEKHSTEPIIYENIVFHRECLDSEIERHKSYGFRYIERLKLLTKMSQK